MTDYESVSELWSIRLKREIIPHKYAVGLLLIIGVLTTTILLVAYPPADGADGMDYYLYAAYMLGADLPAEISNVSPLFPFLLAISYIPFQSFGIILVIQAIFSSLLGLIYYSALRHYSPSFALLLGIIISFDAQLRTPFNFVATEPLYIFLLALAYLVALRPLKQSKLSIIVLIVSLGIILFALTQTRTVGMLLSIPILALYLLKHQQWRLLVGIISVIFIVLGSFQFLSAQANIQQLESFNRNMYARLFTLYDLLDEENGEASTQLTNIRAICSQQSDLPYSDCLEVESGGFRALSSLRESALLETISNNFIDVSVIIARHLVMYLTGTGHQFITPEASPATAQCELPLDNRSERMIDFFTEREWQEIDLTANQEQTLVTYVDDFVAEMCPPLVSSDVVRHYVYRFATLYDFFGLRYPYLWGILLVMAIGAIKPLWRLWLPVSMSGALWLYHASISAVLVNVQPRYIVITNSFRIIVVCSFILACVISTHLLFIMIRNRLLNESNESVDTL